MPGLKRYWFERKALNDVLVQMLQEGVLELAQVANSVLT
jgi:hypothetical protein